MAVKNVPLFSDFKYQVVRSNMKDYAEVVVNYKFRGEDARRVIYLRALEHEGGNKYYIDQATKQIDKEIKNDYLYQHSKRFMRLETFFGLKVLTGIIVGLSVVTIVTILILKFVCHLV